ncbi:MAG: hypothetical protein AAF587_00440 [Bacteroidota bacterium]
MHQKIAVLLLSSLCFTFSSLSAQFLEKDHLQLVLLEVSKPEDVAKCYTSEFHKQEVQIPFAFEDTINNLGDFEFEEEPMEGPDCFVPDLKLIYREYTYIISLYCSKVMKFKNKTPHTPSSKRIENDLVMTPTAFSYLQGLKKQHFGTVELAQDSIIQKLVKTEPLEDASSEEELLEILLTENSETDDSRDLLAPQERFLEDEKEVLELEDEDDPRQ